MSSGRVVIIGAGGHAREVADILRHRARSGSGSQLVGFVADDPENYPAEVGGVPFLGGWSWFDTAEREGLAVICAVGLPQLRSVDAQAVELATMSVVTTWPPGPVH